jgi:muramoyltetrapeptide carboxypeptidase LdcA involved in peptidoglycan recycling
MIHLGQPKSNRNQKITIASPSSWTNKKIQKHKQKQKLTSLNHQHVCVSTTDELVHEKEKYKSITDDLDQTFSELSAY